MISNTPDFSESVNKNQAIPQNRVPQPKLPNKYINIFRKFISSGSSKLLEQKVNIKGTTLHLSLSKIAKKTHVSFFRVLKLKFKGKLDNFLKQHTDKISVLQEEKLLYNLEKLNSSKKQAKKFVKTFRKTHLLSQARVFSLPNNDKIVAVQKDAKSPIHFAAYNKERVLGSGSFGKVYATTFGSVESIVNQTMSSAVIKYAKGSNASHAAVIDLKNEYQVLTDICTENGGKLPRGIQKPPHALIDLSNPDDSSVGYLAARYQSDLRHHKPENLQEAIKCTEDLMEGLAYVHKSGRSHGDIKPENLCVYENKAYALCDFGGVRNTSDIDGGKAFDVYTPNYACFEDELDHQLMIGHVMRLNNNEEKGLKHLENITNFNFSRFQKKLSEEEIDDLKKPNNEREIFKDKSHFFDKLNGLKDLDPQQKRALLKKQAMELSQKHDVFSLGKSLLEITAAVPNFNSAQELLKKMCNDNWKARPSIDEALSEFQRIRTSLTSS